MRVLAIICLSVLLPLVLCAPTNRQEKGTGEQAHHPSNIAVNAADAPAERAVSAEDTADAAEKQVDSDKSSAKHELAGAPRISHSMDEAKDDEKKSDSKADKADTKEDKDDTKEDTNSKTERTKETSESDDDKKVKSKSEKDSEEKKNDEADDDKKKDDKTDEDSDKDDKKSDSEMDKKKEDKIDDDDEKKVEKLSENDQPAGNENEKNKASDDKDKDDSDKDDNDDKKAATDMTKEHSVEKPAEKDSSESNADNKSDQAQPENDQDKTVENDSPDATEAVVMETTLPTETDQPLTDDLSIEIVLQPSVVSHVETIDLKDVVEVYPIESNFTGPEAPVLVNSTVEIAFVPADQQDEKNDSAENPVQQKFENADKAEEMERQDVAKEAPEEVFEDEIKPQHVSQLCSSGDSCPIQPPSDGQAN